MASCTDLHKLSSTNDYRPILKATPIPLLTSKKFVEPFTRLKNRANLFRRKNYSSQLDISNPRASLPADHLIPSNHIPTAENPNVILKRSNSMICPQQRLQTFIKTSNKSQQRNSICLELSDCPIDESSTDDYRFSKSSSNRFWNKKMSNINEQDTCPSDESLNENKNEHVSSLSNEKVMNNNEEKPNPIYRPYISQRQSFDDCKQTATSPVKSNTSTCTMTGKSLNNLDECLSTTSSEDKGVQTTFNDSVTTSSCRKRNTSSTSISSSSTSIQTDSLENKPKIDKLSNSTRQLKSHDKWPHLSLGGQTCIYWVNYLGSTAIKILNDNTSTIPIHAINRLKLSTQYARILPIIGLSISIRGVEFLKHTKERVVICFHDITSIHCACQDQDLRYFAYVTREQRVNNDISNPTIQQSPTNGDYHDYCHVFVVKNESMSTEILLNFGQAFDTAYRQHHGFNSKQISKDKSSSKLDSTRLSTKSNQIISSSSSSSIEERKVFI